MFNKHESVRLTYFAADKRLMKLGFVLICGMLGGLGLAKFLIEHRERSSGSDAEDSFQQRQPRVKSAAFWGKDFAWVVGYKSGDLWRTQDGGKNWQKIPGSAIGGKFHTASFVNEQTGWAVGAGGTIWRSDDTGTTWIRISTLEGPGPHEWSFMSSNQMKFIDDWTGWLRETFGIWRTEDGGLNWKRVLKIGDPGIAGQPGKTAFLNSNLAVVSSGEGKVSRTEDGGKTWQIQTVLKKGDFRDVRFANERSGWLTGYGPPDRNFELYRSGDGGKTWQPLPTKDRDLAIYSIQFLTKEEGWAVGVLLTARKKGQGSPEGLVIHTTDGGENWEKVQVPAGEESFEDIYFADTSHGWLFARESVYRTENSGKDWTRVLSLPH
jgi:photosystem II stability/assembly factor-like uncharacterized protein